MIIRCRDDYNGHWCPCCGTCRCIAKNQFGSKEWSGKVVSTCPLHGRNSRHGNVKMICWDFLPNGKGRPTATDDDGWDDPVVGTKSRSAQ